MLDRQRAQCIRRPFIIMEPTTNNNHTKKPEAPEFEARVQAAECSQGRWHLEPERLGRIEVDN